MKIKIGPYPVHRWYHNWLYTHFGYSTKQSISVSIDKYDTWSMDGTLAHIILPMLKQLKETTHGAPNVDDADVPAAMVSEDHVFDRHCEKWDYILDEMIFAFDSKVNGWEFNVENMPPDTGMKDARIANGFRLFGKYYESLWD